MDMVQPCGHAVRCVSFRKRCVMCDGGVRTVVLFGFGSDLFDFSANIKRTELGRKSLAVANAIILNNFHY